MESVDQAQIDTEASIAESLKTTPEKVSAQHKFPPEPLQELGGKIVDEAENVAAFIRAKTEGSNYVDTTDSKKVISIASIRNKLLGKKAA